MSYEASGFCSTAVGQPGRLFVATRPPAAYEVLLHCDALVGDGYLIDDGAFGLGLGNTPRPIAVDDPSPLSPVAPKFGSACLKSGSTVTIYGITAPAHAEYTLHAWVRPQGLASPASIGTLFFVNMAGGPPEYSLQVMLTPGPMVPGGTPETPTQLVLLTSAGGSVMTNAAPLLVDSVWNHVALVARAGVLRLYVNGVEALTRPHSAFAIHPRGEGRSVLRINMDGNFSGEIDEVALLDGTALWSTGFTPPSAPSSLVAEVGAHVGTPAAVYSLPHTVSGFARSHVGQNTGSSNILVARPRWFATVGFLATRYGRHASPLRCRALAITPKTRCGTPKALRQYDGSAQTAWVAGFRSTRVGLPQTAQRGTPLPLGPCSRVGTPLARMQFTPQNRTVRTTGFALLGLGRPLARLTVITPPPPARTLLALPTPPRTRLGLPRGVRTTATQSSGFTTTNLGLPTLRLQWRATPDSLGRATRYGRPRLGLVTLLHTAGGFSPTQYGQPRRYQAGSDDYCRQPDLYILTRSVP